MSTKKSGIWGIALPLSVVFLAAAYYVKVPEFRKMVDARTPIARNLLGRWVQETGVKTIVMKGELDPAFSQGKAKAPVQAPAAQAPAAPAPSIAKAPEMVAPPVQPPPVPVAPVDLKSIAQDRAKWPKKVSLVKAATFPAVLNGKIVGTLVAPVGAEANLVDIKEGKLGLEFNGGGAWLPAEQTDLIARVQTSR